jgi:hypothetical protein
VGEETVVGVCPKRQIDCFEAIFASSLNDGTPSPRQRFFQKARQHALKRLMFEMIKIDVHRQPFDQVSAGT